jgi:hypothetical protein
MAGSLRQRVAIAALAPVLFCGAARAQPAYSPRDALLDRFPAMEQLRRSTRQPLNAIERQLTEAEAAGGDMSCLRQMLTEVRWRVSSTGDVDAARAVFTRLVTVAAQPNPPSARLQAEDGSYGACVGPWFLRLDYSSDVLLDPSGWRGRQPPRFLDQINNPAALSLYLERHLISNIAVEGVDHRKELNEATSTLVRVILRERPATYRFHPALRSVVWAFLKRWQDPETGFFGAWYRDGDRLIKTVDLSMTFHMASYATAAIGYWPALLDTLLRVKDQRYPNGWLEDHGMSNHHNYDVVRLFRLGWPQTSEEQRRQAGAEIQRMLDWFLAKSLAPDGQIVQGGSDGDSRAATYYFAVSFLDEIGYFNRAKRFWTDRELGGAEEVRQRLLRVIRHLDPKDPDVKSTVEKLGR